MDKLKELMRRCKCGVYVEVNAHRDVYESVEQRLADEEVVVSDDVRAKMIELDTIIRVQFYPNTPIGFYVVYHYDLEAALDACLSVGKERSL